MVLAFISSMGSRAPDSEVFRCPFRDTTFAGTACSKEFASATEARQHLTKVHQGRTVDVEFIVKTETTQCTECGKFLQSCKNGIRSAKCVAPTANVTQGSNVGT